jgi:DNA primase catalytic core
MSIEEFEVGHEMDRALRATVTGLAQLLERSARRRADADRASASAAREDWLAHRDVARQQYVPWLRPGVVEDADNPHDAARAWAAAAAWSTMDPMAKAAEDQLAARIHDTYGTDPAVLIGQLEPAPDAAAGRAGRTKGAGQQLTLQQADEMATDYAPYYYNEDLHISPSGPTPTNDAEKRFLADWQHFADTGALPERTQWEAWAKHTGHGDEIELGRWTRKGFLGREKIDHESRDQLLQRIWNEGAPERAEYEAERAQVALADAGMPDLASQVAEPAGHTWEALTNPTAFDKATPAEITQAWRDARAEGTIAQNAADQLRQMIQSKYGLDANEYLLGAMTERSANNAEAHRTAEDRARTSAEAVAQQLIPTEVTPTDTAAAKAESATPTAATAPLAESVKAPTGEPNGQISRERVLELNKQAQDYFATNFRPGTTGHTYIVDRLGEGAVQGPWALGYAPGGWTNLTQRLKSNGASDADIVAAGLGRVSSRGNVIDAFRNRAMVGIRDQEGDIVGFVGRDLSGDDRAPKYVNTGQTPAFTKSHEVFGLYEAPTYAKIVRAEGAFDAIAISLASDGEAAGVAPMGTAMSTSQAAAIAAKANGQVWLANDRDSAGLKATEHDYYALAQHQAQTRTLTVPGDDPASAWKENPALMRVAMTSLDTAPAAAETIIDRYIDSHSEELQYDIPASRRGLDDAVREVAAANPDPIERKLLAVNAERRRRELVGVADRAAAEGTRLDHIGDRLEGASDNADNVDQAVALENAASTVNHHRDDLDTAADRLFDTAESLPDPTLAGPYDRTAESQLDEVPLPAREARVVSGHGYSQSTADAVAGTSARPKGTPARADRSTPAQRQGRSRSR